MSTEFALVLTNAIRTVLNPKQQSREALAALSDAERAFETKLIPRMKLQQFFERTVEYMRVDNETLLCGVYYVLLLCGETNNALNLERGSGHTGPSSSACDVPPHRSKPFALTMHNVHRFVFTALLVAAKWRSETRVSMEYYALVCGVGRDELCRLEWAMLDLLGFNATVSEPALHFTISYVVSCTIKPSDVIPTYSTGGHGEEASVEDACRAVKYCTTHESWYPQGAYAFVKGLVHAFDDAAGHKHLATCSSELERRTILSQPLRGVVNVLKNLAMVQ